MSALAKAKRGGPPDLAIILGTHKPHEEEDEGGGADMGEDHDDAKKAAVEALAEGLGLKPEDIDTDKVMQALGMLHELHTSEEDDGGDEEDEETDE